MKIKKPKFVFFGTPNLSVWVLEELKNKGILPSMVVTAPDSPSGRNLVFTPSPVKVWAEENNITVHEVKSFKPEGSDDFLKSNSWDIFVVAAYNIILPKRIVNMPKYGILNVHPSLLPKLRGPSPIRSAILFNQKDTVGVTIIKLDEQVDHGPIIDQKHVEIDTWPMKGNKLDELLFREGGKLLAQTMPLWVSGKKKAKEQNHEEATFTKKFEKSDGLIDLEEDSLQNYLKFCAFDSWPRTYFIKNKKRVIITDAKLENGEFKILKVIPEGKKETTWENFQKSN